MRYLTFFFLIFIPSVCFADFSVAVNKTTGEVKGYCNGECGVQGWLDDGYTVVSDVPWETVRGTQSDYLLWTDDGDGEVQAKEIIKKSEVEIEVIKTNKRKKEIRQEIIDLKIRLKESQLSQYADIVDETDKKIKDLEKQL